MSQKSLITSTGLRRPAIHSETGWPWLSPIAAARGLGGPLGHHRRRVTIHGPTRRRAITTSSRALGRQLAGGELVRAHHGLYVPPAYADGLGGQANAALATQPRAVASHWTAASLYGWERLDPPPDDLIHLTIEPRTTTDHRRGIRLHRSNRDPGRWTASGVPVSAPARTVMDIATLPTTRLVAAVALADSALRAGDTTLDDLRAEAAARVGRRGAVRAREVADLAKVGSRSCPETFARVTLVVAGVADPVPGYQICDDANFVVFEGDLVIEDLLLWSEYDGYDVHAERRQFRKDRNRQRRITRRGWHYLPFTDEILAAPQAFVAEMHEEVCAAPARVAALPWGLSPEADQAKRRLAEGPPVLVIKEF